MFPLLKVVTTVVQLSPLALRTRRSPFVVVSPVNILATVVPTWVVFKSLLKDSISGCLLIFSLWWVAVPLRARKLGCRGPLAITVP